MTADDQPEDERPADRPDLVKRAPQPDGAHTDGPDGPEVVDFRPGSPWSRWALGRYLVGRALTESIGMSLLLVALVVLALAAVSEWVLHSTGLAVLLTLLAVFDLVVRWLLLTVVRRLTAFPRYEPIEKRLDELVSDTRGDVFRELRRVGLPSHLWTLPLLALRLVRSSRRAETITALRSFDIDRVVPKARLDETFLLLQQAMSGGVPPSGGAG